MLVTGESTELGETATTTDFSEEENCFDYIEDARQLYDIKTLE